MNKKRRLTPEEVKDIVFAPAQAVSMAIRTIEDRRTTAGVGVRLGLPTVDEYLLPARPGELISVIGMTSNYKSGLMQFWARSAANTIREEQLLDECVIYVTWEQAIEEMLAFDLAATANGMDRAVRISASDIMQGRINDAQMERLRGSGDRRTVTPVFVIGHSIAEGAKRPRLTLDAVGQALQYIKGTYGVKPRAIYLDYLQQMDSSEGDDRRMQVFVNVMRCKDMALAMACPVVLGTQAKREVYEQPWGVPGLADSLESSNLEHTSDKMIGVWLPKTTHELGKILEPKGYDGRLEVTENLLIVKVLKQKMGAAGKWWPCYVDPATNFIGDPVQAWQAEGVPA